jgi:flavin-dependent dehydrogenase
MLTGHWMSDESNQPEVTVIGGGLAGMAACIHLAKAGLKVLCIETERGVRPPVGESLDWSAPDLFAVLGLPMDLLIQEGIATYKKHVTLQLCDGSSRHYVPGEWLGRRPYNIELKTIHVDRIQLDQRVRGIALRQGITFVEDRVVTVETDRRRVTAVNTASGTRISSPWFVDASGIGTNLFPKVFNLPVHEYGPRKVAMWTYFIVPELVEGTTLYADGAKPPYMEWVWEIPVRRDLISVGYVAPGDSIKEKRQKGLTVEGIFREKLARFPRFTGLLQAAHTITPNVTSFQCRVHGGVSGPNWLVMGEAASMVDPMTANGVTAALRHAAEGSNLIIRSRSRKRLPFWGRAMYNKRIVDVGKFFNCGIEKVLYDSPIRNHVGPLTAGDVYTVPAWSFNVVYSRLRPRGPVLTTLYGLLLGLSRASATLYYTYCKRLDSSRQAAG